MAQILHDDIAGAGHSKILLQRIAARNARLQAAQGHEAAHGANVGVISFLVAEVLADRVIATRPGPPDPFGQCGPLGWAILLHHLRITPLSILLSSRQYMSQAISRAAAGEVRGPSMLSINWMRSRTAQRSGVMSPGSLARCRQEMRRRIRRKWRVFKLRPPPILALPVSLLPLARCRWGHSPLFLNPDFSGRGGTCGSGHPSSGRILQACSVLRFCRFSIISSRLPLPYSVLDHPAGSCQTRQEPHG